MAQYYSSPSREFEFFFINKEFWNSSWSFCLGPEFLKLQLGICFEIAKWCQEQQLWLMFTVIWALEEEK